MTKACPFCAERIPVDATECPYCAEPLLGETDDRTRIDQEQPPVFDDRTTVDIPLVYKSPARKQPTASSSAGARSSRRLRVIAFLRSRRALGWKGNRVPLTVALVLVAAVAIGGVASSPKDVGQTKVAGTPLAVAKAPATTFPTAAAANAAGSRLNEQGLYDEAIVAFDAGLGLDPNHAATLANKAYALVRLGRLDEADVATARAIERSANPRTRAVARLNQALSKLGRGDLLGASSTVEAAAVEYPESKVAQQARLVLTVLAKPNPALLVAASKVMRGDVLTKADLAGLDSTDLTVLKDSIPARRGEPIRSPWVEAFYYSKAGPLTVRAGRRTPSLQPVEADGKNGAVIKRAMKAGKEAEPWPTACLASLRKEGFRARCNWQRCFGDGVVGIDGNASGFEIYASDGFHFSVGEDGETEGGGGVECWGEQGSLQMRLAYAVARNVCGVAEAPSFWNEMEFGEDEAGRTIRFGACTISGRAEIGAQVRNDIVVIKPVGGP